MTFEQYWAMLVKRWPIILICLLVVGLGAYIGSKLMKPAYQSSSLIRVVIGSSASNLSSYNDLQTSEQLTQTEADLATGNAVLRQVASHYPGLSVNQLASEVSATTKLNTALFEIDVVDQSSTRAAEFANDIATTMIQQQQQATQQNNEQAQQQLQQSIDQVSKQINVFAEQISTLQAQKGNQGQIALLQVQLSGLEQRYSQEQSTLAQLGLSQVQNGNPLQLVQTAQPSTAPVRPNIPLYTGVGLLVGLLLGMGLAFIYEKLDTRVRTPEEISHLLRWPVLTTIWHAKTSKPENLINPAGQDANVEQYRLLRTNIGFSSLDKPLRSLAVTSAQPRDGKSLIAANLAIFMAKAGKSTLLIDADLHRPTQHTLFNLPPNKLGLSNAMLAFSMPTMHNTPSYNQFFANASTLGPQDGPTITSLSLVPFIHSIGIPNLWVMPTGPLPPNASEIFESKVMERFLRVIADCGIEVVIFDTPPLLGLSDASILASKVDGALIVVDAAHATKEKLQQMKAVLSQTGVHVLGCVANKLKRKHHGSTNYYYTEDQNSKEKFTGNGHKPSIPTTPMIVEPPYEQRISSK